MNIKIRKAISHFFPTPSFPLVYSEAVANALDAGANNISIDIKLASYLDPASLKLTISDDGEGFTEENFARFSYLMDAKDRQHKGLGRLIFLEYFSSVDYQSVYDGTTKRSFKFDDRFSGESNCESVPSGTPTGSLLEFGPCVSARFNSYSDLRPGTIKQQLLAEFLPILLERKMSQHEFDISITLNVDQPNAEHEFVSGTEHLTSQDLPDFDAMEFPVDGLDLYAGKCRMLYSVGEVDPRFHYVKTALVVDGRSINLPLLKNDSIPTNARAIFLLKSEYFDAKTDDSRKELTLKYEEKIALELAFREKVAEVLAAKIPEIGTRNAKTAQDLGGRFPHLRGLFDEKTVGIIDYDKALRFAQEQFFKEQKELLEADALTDEQYRKSIDHASRVLAEYVLYREKMITKVESMTGENHEAEIHNVILPKGNTLAGSDFFSDRFTNNAWMLDDKYMSYQYVLSDENIRDLIAKVSSDEERGSSDLRPDLALVFSDDVTNPQARVDVVVVEMKKRGTTHLRTVEAVNQLRQRARRLLAYYPNKIQRMWFFGLVDFDKETKLDLMDNWTPLFSADEAYYKNELMTPCDENLEPVGTTKYPVSMTLLSFDAFFKDARLRNHAFLQILKDGVREYAARE